MALYAPSAYGATLQDNLTVLIDLDHSAFGHPTEDVGLAIRHMCGLALPADNLSPLTFDDYDEVAKDYYERIGREDPTGQQLLIFLIYVSGYFHELRHAHDLIGTTYGQEVLYQKLNLYHNTPYVLEAFAHWLEEDPKRRVPLPLSLQLGELADLENYDQLCDLLDHYSSVQSDIAAFDSPSHARHTVLRTEHLLETSAIDVQLDFVHDLFGDEAVYILTEFIGGGGRADVYLRIRNDLAEAFHSSGYRGYGLGAIINYLVWCALMGSVPPGGKLGETPSPTILFEAITEYVLRNSQARELTSVRDDLRHFYSSWGILPPQHMIEHMKTKLSKRHAEFAEGIATLAPGDEYRLGFVKADEYFIEAFHKMTDFMDSQLEGYFGGRRYVWNVILGVLPSVHVKVRVNGTEHDTMSSGTSTVHPDEWTLVAAMSTIFNLLARGRGMTRVPFFEDTCFKVLTTTGWGNVPLRFRDVGPLFSAF